MAFTIPNEADAAFADQAEIDSIDLSIMTAADAGTGIVSGCAVTAQGTPDMTVAVASGTALVAGAQVSVTGGNVTITAADVTNPRFDLVVVNNAGTKSAQAGTPSSNPVFPAIPANSVVLAAVYVPANDTDIDADQIVDKRVFTRVDGWSSVTFSRSGNLSTLTGAHRWYNDTGGPITLLSARGSVGTAPTTQSILVDINNNGTSVWNATQANRITIAAGTNTDEGGAFDDSTVADGEYITVDIDQVGSGTVGADLTVTIWYTS